jgi:type IV secretory pathway protease TraF
MVRAYQTFSGLTLLATYGGGTIPDEIVELQNGVTVTGLAGDAGSEKFFKIVVPAGQSKLEIVMAGGTGDADLYVRKTSKPSTTEWDYRPYLSGNNETVTIDNPTAATYYVMVRGYVAYASLTLKGTYTPVPEEVTVLQNGVAVTGLSGASASETFYKIVVPAGQDLLHIATSGGTGDVDLYVRKGSKPTLTSYDYRPYLIGNNETVEVANPAAATWYVMLRGYQTYANLTLVATYSVTLPGNDFTKDPNAVALWKFEGGKLTLDSLGTNTLANENNAVVADTVSFKEGESAARFKVAVSWAARNWLSIPTPTLRPTSRQERQSQQEALHLLLGLLRRDSEHDPCLAAGHKNESRCRDNLLRGLVRQGGADLSLCRRRATHPRLLRRGRAVVPHLRDFRRRHAHRDHPHLG